MLPTTSSTEEKVGHVVARHSGLAGADLPGDEERRKSVVLHKASKKVDQYSNDFDTKRVGRGPGTGDARAWRTGETDLVGFARVEDVVQLHTNFAARFNANHRR